VAHEKRGEAIDRFDPVQRRRLNPLSRIHDPTRSYDFNSETLFFSGIPFFWAYLIDVSGSSSVISP
jgi:hypothetical protein